MGRSKVTQLTGAEENVKPSAPTSEGKDLSTECLQGAGAQPVWAGVSNPFLTLSWSAGR